MNLHRVEHVPGFEDIQDEFHVAMPGILDGKDWARRTFKPGLERHTIQEVMEAVSAVSGVSVRAIKGESRTGDVMLARWVAICLVRDITECSQARLARAFNRCHTTIKHVLKNVGPRMDRVEEYRVIYARAKAML